MSFRPQTSRIKEAVPHFYSFSKWQNYPIVAGYIDRSYNFTSYIDTDEKRKFLSRLDIDLSKIIFSKQIHSKIVLHITEEPSVKYPEGDGLVTQLRCVPLGVVTADCVPVFFYSHKENVIGLVHAGWRGACAGIIDSVLNVFDQSYQVNMQDIEVAFGPCIHECCYEVGDDVASVFTTGITHRDGKKYLNLSQILCDQLVSRGVQEENIDHCEVCTSCMNDMFYSYRREGKEAGRLLSVIMMR